MQAEIHGKVFRSFLRGRERRMRDYCTPSKRAATPVYGAPRGKRHPDYTLLFAAEEEDNDVQNDAQ
jgi:hypothetical protein